jgi:hypothetical protein
MCVNGENGSMKGKQFEWEQMRGSKQTFERQCESLNSNSMMSNLNGIDLQEQKTGMIEKVKR